MRWFCWTMHATKTSRTDLAFSQVRINVIAGLSNAKHAYLQILNSAPASGLNAKYWTHTFDGQRL